MMKKQSACWHRWHLGHCITWQSPLSCDDQLKILLWFHVFEKHSGKYSCDVAADKNERGEDMEQKSLIL